MLYKLFNLPSKNNNNNNIILGITSNSELKVKNDNFNFFNDYYLKCNAFGNLNSKFEISSQLINSFIDVKLSLNSLSYSLIIYLLNFIFLLKII